MKALHMVSFFLMAVGGLNWGLVGLGWLVTSSDWNVVHMILGSSVQLEAVVYLLVGLATAWVLIGHKGDCKTCANGAAM